MKIILLLLCICKYVYSATPVVKVQQGTLSGKEYTTSNGKVINAFLGVPFAAPPTGDNRFKDPQELKQWENVWDASSERNECLQLVDDFLTTGDEDCLYTNIYTPKLPTDGKNPNLNVLVFIHGGSFMVGSGNDLLPDYLLGIDDFVFVTFNYRLGAFGFLSTNDEECPGNFGLKDQAAALKWVKNNIKNFGGNPESVTIAGNSAGAASVHFHMISSTNEELFQKAISFSGTSLNPWAFTKNAVKKANKLASLVECSNTETSSKEMIKCLRKKPPKELLNTYKHFSIVAGFPPMYIFSPVVEPKISNAFLTDNPLDVMRSGKIKDVPWLIGMVKDEGLLSAAAIIKSEQLLNILNQDWPKLAPVVINYDDIESETKKNEISSNIKNFYFGESSINKENSKQLVELISDSQFFNGIIDSAISHNSMIKNNVYMQKFSYRGERSFTNLLTGNTEDYGVCHNDDLLYYMKQSEKDKLNTESDKAMSKLLSSIIVNFMSSGNPNKIVPYWEPVAKKANSDIKFLNIYSATDMKIEEIPDDSSKRKFWKTVLSSGQHSTANKTNSSCKQFIATYLVMFAVFMLILFK